VECIRREFLLRRVKGDEEQRDLRRLQSGFGFDAVLAAAAAASGVPAAVLRAGRFRNRQARDLLAALSRRYCRGALRAGALASAMGLTYSRFVHASERGRIRAAAGDPAWTTAVSHLAQNGVEISVQRQVWPQSPQTTGRRQPRPHSVRRL
jgi:hypothetical protein